MQGLALDDTILKSEAILCCVFTLKDSANSHAEVDVSSLRRSATGEMLEREDLDNDPARQFDDWMRQACELDTPEPNAMSLATVDKNN